MQLRVNCAPTAAPRAALALPPHAPLGTHSRVLMSTIWHSVSAIMDVLPVPLCACAMTSRPDRMGTTARCWMADGFSKP
jgi:hypothetical protein